MRENKKKSVVIGLSILSVVFAMLVFNCRSTKVERAVDEETARELGLDTKDKIFTVYDVEEFENCESDDYWIFLRLYQPAYTNPLYIENFLNGCIRFTEVNEDFSSHSAINFSLDDNFYGLTSSNPEQNLNLESCTYPYGNAYMVKCDLYNSIETTYALKVREDEYKKAKELVEKYYQDERTRYSVKQNFKISRKAVKRKYFTAKKNRALGEKPAKTADNTFVDEQYDFVCSTFIAYVLANSVDEIHDFFVEKGIDSNYVVPSDIAYFPGVIKLFKTTWGDYNIGAKAAVKKYPCLAPFYREPVIVKNNEKN